MYSPSGPVLFLIACSRQKKSGGRPSWNASDAITAHLGESLAKKLTKRRMDIWQQIRYGTEWKWQSVPLWEHEFNQELEKGPDVGGDTEGKYLPAMDRYDGRFYRAFGTKSVASLASSRHHLLIVSGLYGVLTPFEPIQLYTCPVEPPVAQVWRGNPITEDCGVITSCIRSYCSKHRIERVFDLLAMDNYRGLVDWPRLEADLASGVIRCFNRIAAGADGLMDAADLLSESLLQRNARQLLSIKQGDELSSFVFGRHDSAAATLPQYKALPQEEGSSPPQNERGDDRPPIRWYLAPSNEYLRDRLKYLSRYGEITEAEWRIQRHPIKPCGDTVKKLDGDLAGKWRYRIDNIRLIYEPEPEHDRVKLLAIGPRGDVYKDR